MYQRRHAGRCPRQVVVYKTSEFRYDEINGCHDAWRAVEALDLIHVQQDTSWRGIQLDAVQRPGRYPCHRGSYLPIGGTECLLWTQGNAPTAVGGADFYKEGKGIPSPLLICRYSGHSSWNDICAGILGLTKMNWNTDSLYGPLPVTIRYASILARTIKRIPQLGSKPYEFRYFM